jgi:hypothetical protein
MGDSDEQSGESSNDPKKIEQSGESSGVHAKPIEPAKKTRGRPSSKKNIASTQVKGIVSTPISENNIVEMISNHLQIFKKLPDILKTFNVHRIWFKLTIQGINIYFMDHLRNIYNKLCIPSNSMVAYYFSVDTQNVWVKSEEDQPKPTCIYLASNRDNLSDVLKGISDNFKEIRFIILRNDKKWFISITTDTGSVEVNDIPRIDSLPYCPPKDTPEYEAEVFNYDSDKEYELSFEMDSSEIKKLILRADDNINISKNKMNQIIIGCRPKDGVAFWVNYDAEKHKMKTTLASDEVLSVSINAANLKFAANSSVAFMNKVKISLSANKPMSIKWYSLDILDREICYLHSYIKIVK